jgi:hypothetical protein
MKTTNPMQHPIIKPKRLVSTLLSVLLEILSLFIKEPSLLGIIFGISKVRASMQRDVDVSNKFDNIDFLIAK